MYWLKEHSSVHISFVVITVISISLTVPFVSRNLSFHEECLIYFLNRTAHNNFVLRCFFSRLILWYRMWIESIVCSWRIITSKSECKLPMPGCHRIWMIIFGKSTGRELLQRTRIFRLLAGWTFTIKSVPDVVSFTDPPVLTWHQPIYFSYPAVVNGTLP